MINRLLNYLYNPDCGPMYWLIKVIELLEILLEKQRAREARK